MTTELLVEFIAQLVSIATLIIGFAVAPQYQELAIGIVLGVQGIAVLLVTFFVGRKLAALSAQIKRLGR